MGLKLGSIDYTLPLLSTNFLVNNHASNIQDFTVIILKMVEIPTHKRYIFLIVMIRCIELNVRQVPWGSSPPLSLYNLEIILKMVEIPTYKPIHILDNHNKMH